ncbi:MAG: AAA family ATPase, partial [Holosporaceae bacterium]|nr:AAA family ATPase [Holosporaceae bacterium]
EDLSEQLYGVTKLGKFKDRPAGKLSGGMYKKLGLMCVLLRSPKVILLDEPTNGVDPISRREFWNILNNAVANNVLVIMTTAYMDEAERCGCVHLMENGVAIDAGEPQRLLLQDNVKNFDQFFLKRAKKNE